MFSPVLRELIHPVKTQIIEVLKCSDGMPVRALSESLKMSYMGVKQHCAKLESQGFLSSWRMPRRAAGRPERLYRVTEKCDPIFPEAGVGFSLTMLEAVKAEMGGNAPEKLLFRYFNDLKARWAPKLKKGASLVEKATRLTALRDELGIFSRCQFDPDKGFRIEEYHHPLKPIFEAYPSALRMETQMIQELLGTSVQRSTLKTELGTEIPVLLVNTL